MPMAWRLAFVLSLSLVFIPIPCECSRGLLATCKSKIPACVAERCSSRNVQGVPSLVCEQCMQTYIKSAAGLNCVCPSGTYELCSGSSCKCVSCEKGFYCEGGKSTAPNGAKVVRGVRRSCHKQKVDPKLTTAAVQAQGMTTQSVGSKRQSDCVTMPGFYMDANKQQAIPCPANAWSAGSNRAVSCTKCKAGLAEDPAFTAAADAGKALRTDVTKVCMVPDGKFYSEDVARDCPVGFFRVGYLAVTSDAAKQCRPCPKAVTTQQPGSKSVSDCQVVLPGYNINMVDLLAGQRSALDGGLEATEPEQCPQGTFFEGGVVPAAGGPTCQPCPLGTTTLEVGARSSLECVTMPGFYMDADTQQAIPCPANTWSAGSNRALNCTRCKAGLAEDPAFTADADAGKALRTDVTKVCMVPDGKFYSEDVARDCPVGFFRVGYLVVTSDAAKQCLPCPKAVTTQQPGSKSASDCQVVLPGYNINMVDLLAGQSSAPDGGLNATEPERCPQGTFFEGGVVPADGGPTCQPCPLGTTTRELGARSSLQCVVPPGYYLQLNGAGGNLVKCPTNVGGIGYYRMAWRVWNDTTVQDTDGTTACTPCGQGILSEWTQADEMGSANSASLVAASSASCYIEPGWSMTRVADGVFSAAVCPVGSYGVAARTYGLASNRCEDCWPDQTTVREGATSERECTNPGGFGVVTPEGDLEPCEAGFYSPAGSNAACQACPPGRTTAGEPEEPELQDSKADCYVIEGHGLLPLDVAAAGNESVADLPVQLCPVGYYSPGLTVDARCMPCEAGYNTTGEGTAGMDNGACRKCMAGYGRTDKDKELTCSLCDYGTYQTGYDGVWDSLGNAGDGEICLNCPVTKFKYVTSTSGTAEVFDTPGITLARGAKAAAECVPRFQQLVVYAGSTYGLPSGVFTSVTKSTATDCMAACTAQSDIGLACFNQFDYPNTMCSVGTMPVATESTTSKLLVKLMPAGGTSGAIGAVGAVGEITGGGAVGPLIGEFIGAITGMSSGHYRQLDISAFSAEKQAGMGTVLSTVDIPDGVLEPCLVQCDKATSCWAVTVAGTTCTLRTGGIQLDVRSFFFNPRPGSV